jgi:Tfp pilus assembly protein PilF
MRKYLYLSSLVLVLLLCIAFMNSVSMIVQAIGEVTATPAPEEPGDNTGTEEVDIQTLLDEGLADLEDGNFRSAISKMDIVLEIDPEIALAYAIRAIAHIQLSQLDDAINDFSSAIELEPWSIDYYIFRGDTYGLQGEFVDALLNYDMAIDINPLSADVYNRRSQINFELGDNDAGDTDDLIARGLGAVGTGDILIALDFLTEAIDSTHNNEVLASIYYVRGITYLNTSDQNAAIEDFTLAIEADPTLHNSYLARGISYRQNGNMQAAGQDFFDRITTHGAETIEIASEMGAQLDIDMAYRRVYAISFEGQAGQEVTISARDFGGTFIDPLIAVVDPNGVAIAGDDDFGGALDSEIDNFELPEDGTYTLYVSHAEGGYNFGFQGIVRVNIDG